MTSQNDGTVGSLFGIIYHGVAAGLNGYACIASEGAAGCQQAYEHGQGIINESEDSAGAEFTDGSAPADVVSQALVDKLAADFSAMCAHPECAAEVDKYIRQQYDPMTTAWYLAAKNGHDNQWGQAEYDIAAAQIAAVYNTEFNKKVGEGVAAIVAKEGNAWQTGNGSAATSSFDHPGGGGIPATFDSGTGTPAKPAADSSSVLPTVLGVVALAAAGWTGYRVYKGKPVLPKF